MLRRISNEPPAPAWRWVAGALVVLLAAVRVSAWIDNHVEGDWWVGVEAWTVSVKEAGMLGLAGFVAGFIVRRWEAVLLALLPILVAIPFGVQDPDGFHLSSDRVADSMAEMAVICAAFIAVGVIAAAAVGQSIRPRGPHLRLDEGMN